MRRRNRILFRRVTSLAAAAAIAMAALPAIAITVTGTNGANGSAGTPGNPGTAGGDGTTDPNANAFATQNNTIPQNTANAIGGNGGAGGVGGDGNVGGANGGKGGNGASAGSGTATTSGADTDTSAATGGNGGDGGNGGARDFPGLAGAGGNGGAGGSASASANGPNSSNDAVMVSATVTGGNGGAGGSGRVGGNGGAAGGGSIAQNAVSGISFGGGAVSATAKATGGNGGNGGTGSNGGGIGGNGADASLNNAVTGSTTGALTLEQDAFGGNGGSTTNNTPGAAGMGSSSLTYSPGSPVTVNLTALGGTGGYAQNVNAAAGGASSINANITGNDTVTLNTMNDLGTQPGTGGYITGGNGLTAGAGGGSTATVTASSNSTAGGGHSAVNVDVNCYAQDGGSFLNSAQGNGGVGGAANVNVFAFNVGPDPVQVQALAKGENGGAGVGNGFVSGSGGTATCIAIGTSSGGAVTVQADASAGYGGSVSSGATVGNEAGATATASASSPTNAQATALGGGVSGTSTATAKTTASGLFSFVQANSSGPIDGITEAVAQTLNHQTTPTLASFPSYNAISVASANPKTPDITSAWSGDNNVQNDFGNLTTNVNALGILSVAYPSNGSGADTVSSALELNENNASLSASNLHVGLLGMQTSGLSSDDTLRFRIVRGGTTLMNNTFTVSSFSAFFNNSDVELGITNAGLSGSNLDLQFLLDLTSTHANESIGVELAVGTTSAPVICMWNFSGNTTSAVSWENSADWQSQTIPDGPGALAYFTGALTASRAITLDENTTVGQIVFSNLLASYTIAAGTGGSLTLDNAGAAAAINSSLGTHLISAPVILTSPGVTMAAASSSALVISGSMSGAGPITVAGPGEIVFTGPSNSYSGNTSVNAGGTLVIGNLVAAGSLPATTTLVSGGFTEFFYNPSTGILPRTVAGITLSSGGSVVVADPFPVIEANRQVLITSALTFGGNTGGWQGLLNLESNDMIVRGGNLANITNQLAEGHGVGSTFWTGTAGIISSAAAATPSKTALAVELNDDGTPAHNPLMTTFAGQTVGNTDVLVKYTFVGDADLSGRLTAADYVLADNGFNSQSGPNPLSGWRNGDFNYDGHINGDDYTLIDNAFNTQGSVSFADRSAGPAEMIARNTEIVAVPEPTSLVSMSLAASLLARRRRQRG